MQKIQSKLFCHLSSINRLLKGANEKGNLKDNYEIVQSDAKEVDTFYELVTHITHIGYNVKEYFPLYYRGQTDNYDKNGTKCDDYTTLWPSIYRNREVNALKSKFENLDRAVELLRENLYPLNWRGSSQIRDSNEICWAVLQHYGVCHTPMIDLTRSLRVACSFALLEESPEDKLKEFGYVYLLGLPYLNDYISQYFSLKLVNIDLTNFFPPDAVRPFHQHGFLACSIPYHNSNSFVDSTSIRKVNPMDFNRRLVAKFKIRKKDFWGKHNEFGQITMDGLYPIADPMRKIAEKVKEKLI